VALAAGLVAAAIAALAIFAFGPVHTRAAFPGPNGKIAFGRNKTGIPKIYAMNADGSQVHRLTRRGDDPAFSPNGTKIAFQRSKKGKPPGIYVMNADGSEVHRLTTGSDDSDPAFSPNGRKIAFTRSTRRGGIYLMNADGSHQHRLARNGGDPAYSATSGKIAFAKGSVGIGHLYVMNADGSHRRRLARGTTPDFSPDGRKIAFVRVNNLTAVPHIYVMHADGSHQHRLAGGFDAAFSPDGKEIAFSGYDLNIHVMNADGSHKQQLTNSGEDEFPSWGVLTCTPLPC
jgi:TolB protein